MHSPQQACSLLRVQTGEDFVFTVRDPATVEGQAIGVSYAAFVDDVQVGQAAPGVVQIVCSQQAPLLQFPV